MSKNKKSFLIHIDSLDVLDDLTNEQAGELFNAIRSHQIGEEIELHGVVRIAFSPFKNQFKRDDEKYQMTCKRRAEAGSLGGKQKVANASKCKQTIANVADNKTKNKNKTKNDSDNEIKELSRFAEFWNLYGKKTDSKKCEAKFKKLTKAQVDLIFEKLPAYVKSTPDKQYRKNPITWLNNESWNDEIQLPTGQTPTHNFSEQKYKSGRF